MKKKIIFSLLAIFLITCFSSLIFSKMNLTNVDKAKYNNVRNTQYLLSSNLFTHKDILDTLVQDSINMEQDGFNLYIENENYKLYVNESTGAIRYHNLVTNYVWSSDVLNISNYAFNVIQKRQAQSAFEFTYRNEKNMIKTSYAFECDLNISKVGNSIIFKVNNTAVKIKFSYELTVENQKLKVNFDTNKIVEYGKNLITDITFYKYLGAAYKDSINGYIFIPNGSGALIRYEQNQAIRTEYRSSFYGLDYAYSENQIQDSFTLPIYGMVHGVNQNACLVEIESGAELANLRYSPSTIGKYFNMIYSTFMLRNVYSLPIAGSGSVVMIPKNYVDKNISFSYNFLNNEDANYFGMALKYQDILLSRNMLKNNTTDSFVHLEFLGMDYEKGIIFKKKVKMASTSDIKKINSELTSKDITNIAYTLRGFSDGGNSASYKKFNYASSLGSLNNLKGLDYDFYYNPANYYLTSKNGNSNTMINMYNKKGVIELEKEKYLNLSSVKNMISNLNSTKDIKKYNYAFDGITNYLYGDKSSKTDKSESMEKIIKSFDKTYPMYRPNYYLLDKTSRYYNLNLYHDKLKFITDSVPFIEILIRGYIPYYSSQLNFSSNYELDVLKCIETGTYPTFMLTKEESYKLAKSLSNDYFATTYYRVKDQLIDSCLKINEALSLVVDEKIVSREIIEEGIIKVGYSNGVNIYVNYTDEVYENLDLIVNAKDYKVVGL